MHVLQRHTHTEEKEKTNIHPPTTRDTDDTEKEKIKRARTASGGAGPDLALPIAAALYPDHSSRALPWPPLHLRCEIGYVVILITYNVITHTVTSSVIADMTIYHTVARVLPPTLRSLSMCAQCSASTCVLYTELCAQ